MYGNQIQYLLGKVTKGIYDTLLGAIIFYNKLKEVLEGLGFKVNDYDKCSFNKMVEGVQCTIQFHMDDLKLWCIHQEVLYDIIKELNKVFGQDGLKLSVIYGAINNYLGTTMNWSNIGRVRFAMYNFLEDILEETPSDYNGEDTIPAIKSLFQVDDLPFLSEELVRPIP